MPGLLYLLLFPLLISCSGTYFSEEREFRKFVQKDFEEQIQKNSEFSTLSGLNSGRGQWRDLSESSLQARWKKVNKNLKELSSFDVSSFSKKTQLSWKLFKLLMEEEKENFDFRFHIIHPLFERPSEVIAFLINTHSIENIKEAKDYVSRVRGIKGHFDQVIQKLRESAKRDLTPPRFVFPKVEENIKSFLKGYPFDSQREHILVRDFDKKISALNLSPLKKKKLNKELEQALLEFYKPAYENFLNYWRKLKVKSGNHEGLWSQPQGQEYYASLILKMANVDLTPEEVHQWGLKEVQRLHLEITQLKNTLNFKGSLLDFLNSFRNSRKFYYQNREVYITHSRTAVAESKKTLSEFFKKIPKYPIRVKQAEVVRGRISAGDFYQPPSVKRNRPGIFYVNLYPINGKPKYSLKASTFNKTFPGHHLQISMALSLKSLPQFQRHAQFAAFTKGWTLYAERLAGEMGFYTGDYDQFGALASELMRACSLVVDTGIHYRRWSRDQAIGYLIQNSDLSYDSAVRLVEKSIVKPGQAVAYTIGFLKILELRDLARKTLKNQFDIREFHHQVLKNGSVPLMLLEENIRHWLKSSRQS